jgi:AcrR family transcriptional regulator
MTMEMEQPSRRQRSDGMRTRGQILTTAAALATVEGLDRLSIGGLADHIGISKSGVYAHFRSKEALQLATVDTAWEIFDREVVDRAKTAPPGRARVIALIDEFMDHLERQVFPGGCFFASTVAEMRMRPGPVTERLAEFDWYWMGLLRSDLEVAQTAGEIDASADIGQLAFEIESHVVHAHLRYPIHRDRAVLDRARDAVRRRLGVPTTPGRVTTGS